MRRGIIAASLSSLLTACAGSASSNDADLILFNGTVLTVDSADRVAQAIAIKGEKIVAVGSDIVVQQLAGPRTQRIDLQGLTVTPGLIDAHQHFSGGAVERKYVLDISFPDTRSLADVRARLRARVDSTPAGGWVLARGWDEGKLAEHRYISARDVDDVSSNHPVILGHTTGHYLTANSVVLKLAGISATTKDPPGGTIDRYPDGSPTGVLKESAMGLVSRLVPDLETPQNLHDAMKSLVAELNAEGMTGLKDPGINQSNWDAYKRLEAEGALNVRVFALWSGGRSMADAQKLIADKAATTKPYESTGDDHVIAGGVKLYADGSGGARTAWLYTDWNRNLSGVDRGNHGYPAINPDTLRALIKAYHDAGFHISVHSIGDQAIDWVVDSYDSVMTWNPQPGRRHGIIHANIPSDHAIARMTDLQHRYDAAYPEPSATFMWWIGDTYAGNFGPVRARRLDPFKTFATRGIVWAGGSDFPVTPFAARYGIWASVARRPLLGTYGNDVYGASESVDVHTALRSFSLWAAHQMFLDRKTGSIEAGKYADLAVWDRDLYAVPTDQLKDVQCQLTIFNGKIVFRRDGTRLTVSGAGAQ